MRRAVLILLLVLSFAFAFLAVLGHFQLVGFSWVLHDDQFRAVEPAWRMWLGSYSGEVLVRFEHMVRLVPNSFCQPRGCDLNLNLRVLTIFTSSFGIGYAGGWRNEWWQATTIGVPFGALSVGLGLYPAYALWWRPLRARRRKRGRECRRCGYNLTGNVSGVCPECGERI